MIIAAAVLAALVAVVADAEVILPQINVDDDGVLVFQAAEACEAK